MVSSDYLSFLFIVHIIIIRSFIFLLHKILNLRKDVIFLKCQDGMTNEANEYLLIKKIYDLTILPM